jgi:hypothetical protein
MRLVDCIFQLENINIYEARYIIVNIFRMSSWQDVDKTVSKAIKEGLIHKKTLDNTPLSNIRAINFFDNINDDILTPQQWNEYSHKLLAEFDDVLNDKVIPNWNKLWFRHEGDFKAGSFGLYPDIWMIFINCLPNDKTKYIAYNHIVKGICILDNQNQIDIRNAKPYHRAKEKFMICTKKIPHEENLKLLEKMNIRGDTQLEIAGWEIKKHGYYPVRVRKQEGSLVRKPFLQPNAKFLLENPEEITKQVIKWISSGALEYVGPCNITRSPLRTSLVLVYNENSDKFRTCFDGGSLKLTEAYSVPCVLDEVVDALLFLEKNDYMTKFDDASGFLQAFLDKQSSNLCHIRWGQHIFKYYGAAFGIPRIPGDFQLLNSCGVSFLRAHGIPISLYLDDRLVNEKQLSEEDLNKINLGELAPKNAFLTCMTIIASGGFVSRKKSTPLCSRIIDFLGFTINTENETISIPPEKWTKFQLELNEIINAKLIPFKALEKLRGKMCSFITVITNLRLYIRRITEYLCLADQNDKPLIKNDDRLREELGVWVSTKLRFIKTTRPWIEKQSILVDPKIYMIWTDASDLAGGYVDHDGHERTIYFNNIEMSMGIVIKEGLAILRYLEFNAKRMKNKRILFYCDNEGVVGSFYNGSKNSHLNDIIRCINMLAVENNMIIAIFWVSTDIQKADKASRTIDLKEEILSDQAYDLVCKHFTPTIDCMATAANSKCTRYYSRFHEDMALNKNFLTIIPNIKEILYCFPPKTLASITARHIFNMPNRFIFIFHVMSELPYFVAFRPEGSLLIRLDTECEVTTLIPCKKRDKKYNWYTPNTKMKSIFAIIKK